MTEELAFFPHSLSMATPWPPSWDLVGFDIAQPNLGYSSVCERFFPWEFASLPPRQQTNLLEHLLCARGGKREAQIMGD